MNISLEEQIEYMRGEVEHWEDRCFPYGIEQCKAILATLEAVRDDKPRQY
jgi:hypothetical protein